MDGLIIDLRGIYLGRARQPYGLTAVHQLQHALQCAWAAERAGATPESITASLLHDVGHLVHDLGEHPAAQGLDDRHQERGADWLAWHFDASVTEPVRLHVRAKRYLCARRPGYVARLSPDSIESLVLQGGPMSAAECADFECERHFAAAIRLREWDDAAKDPRAVTPDWSHFERYILLALASATAIDP